MKSFIASAALVVATAPSYAEPSTIEIKSLTIPRDRGQDLITACEQKINSAIATGKIKGLMASHLSDPNVFAFSIGKELNADGEYDRKLECITDKGASVSFRMGR